MVREKPYYFVIKAEELRGIAIMTKASSGSEL